jgi:Protein kinase domain
LEGRYLIQDRLGAGGMGAVWRGRDQRLKRDVAIKVLTAQPGDQDAFKRFEREAVMAARLDHDGITKVYDFGQHSGENFIVMELLEGRDLRAELAQQPRGLSVTRAVGLARQAADALAAAHAGGVVHRDIKPANLFVRPGDRLKVCDFGIAKATDATRALTATGVAFGTPPYMAPERFTGSRGDARSDLYSLGCVLYEMLTGQLYAAAAGAPAIALDQLARKGVPGPLTAITCQMLSVSPQGRPATAAAVAVDLSRVDTAPRQGAPAAPRQQSPALASIAPRLRLDPMPSWVLPEDEERIYAAARELAAMTPQEAALALGNADLEDAGAVLCMLPSSITIPIFSAMDADLAAGLLHHMVGRARIAVLNSMSPDYVAAKVIGPFDQDSGANKSLAFSSDLRLLKDRHAGAILACLPPSHAAYLCRSANIHEDDYILTTMDRWKAQAIIKKLESPDW